MEILGEDGEVYEVEGEDLVGDDEYDVEGAVALPRRSPLAAARLVAARRPAGNFLRLPPKPQWRRQAVAPGVNAPNQMMMPLPLAPDSNNGVFDATHTSISYTANPQRPFQAQRLVIDFRTNVAPSGILLRITYISIGVDIQSVVLADMPATAFAPTAFGVRMKLKPAQPGIIVTVNIKAEGAFAVGPPAESIPCSVMFLGHAIA